jgi:AcrR family transcriptional regulator
MARPRTVTDEEIAQAAREVFRERGAQASVAEVAQRLGVSAPAVLKRVGRKEQLLLSGLAPRSGPRFVEALSQGPQPGDPRAQLVASLVEAERAFREVAPQLAILRTSGLDLSRLFPAGSPSPNVLARRALAGWLQRATGWPEPRCAAATELLLGAIESRGFLAWIAVDPVDTGDTEGWIGSLVDAACPDLERKE